MHTTRECTVYIHTTRLLVVVCIVQSMHTLYTRVCSIHNIVRSYIIYILASIFSSIMNNKNTIVRGVFIQYGYLLE